MQLRAKPAKNSPFLRNRLKFYNWFEVEFLHVYNDQSSFCQLALRFIYLVGISIAKLLDLMLVHCS